MKHEKAKSRFLSKIVGVANCDEHYPTVVTYLRIKY